MAAMVMMWGLLGWLGGLAANLLADSLPHTRRWAGPHCPACTAPRPLSAWSGLLAIPLRSGRCAYCGTRRGLRGPVVELVGMALFALLYLRDPRPGMLLPALLVGFTFLLITVIDLEHRLIPHVIVLPAAVVLGAIGILDPSRGAVKVLAGGLAGAGSFYVLYLMGGVFARAMSRARGQAIDEVAFGFGDVTLAGLIGLIVGWPAVVLALLIGILAAGVFSLGHVLVSLLRRKYSAFTPIPYGPFLILGASLVYFGGRELFQSILLP
jgi:prepilin signal peptidase PulO-like enzyme (type II secretory pathway)